MVSWFISPWEAARFSMEAQRMIALQFFGFALPKAHSKAQSREEGAEEKAVAPHRNPSIPLPDDVTPSKGMELGHRKVVAARSNTQMTKRASGSRKRKSRAGRGKKWERVRAIRGGH